MPTALLVADTVLNVFRALQPQWGIYLNGVPIIASSVPALLGLSGPAASFNSLSSLFGEFTGISTPNIDLFSVVEFDYRQDHIIANYPIEKGSFQNYDKVEMPFGIKMRIAAGGSEQNRQALIDKVEYAKGTLDLYDVVTPEATYQGCNIEHVDYSRKAQNGVGLIAIDIWLVEIRITSTSEFLNTLVPGVSGQQANGNVQTRVPTVQELTMFGQAL